MKKLKLNSGMKSEKTIDGYELKSHGEVCYQFGR